LSWCVEKIFVEKLERKKTWNLVGSRHTWSFCARFIESWEKKTSFCHTIVALAFLKSLSYFNAFMCKRLWCAICLCNRKFILFCDVENVHSLRIPSALSVLFYRSIHSFAPWKKGKQCTHKFINFRSFFPILFHLGSLNFRFFAIFFILPRNYSSVNSLTLTFPIRFHFHCVASLCFRCCA
jgi:hypothetical protein